MKFSKWLIETLCNLIDEEYIEANQPAHSDSIAINMANAAKEQLSGSLSSAIQKVNQLIGTSLPHENLSLKNIKHKSAEILMKGLQQIVNSKNTTLQDCDALLKKVEDELSMMRKEREEHGNTDPGIYDSLLEVCKRTVQRVAETNKGYIEAFEEEIAGDGQSPKALFYDLLRFFLKKYFIVSVDYYKNYTPKVNELKKNYTLAQTEILQDIFQTHLDDLLYFLEEFNNANTNSTLKEKNQGNIYYSSIRDMLTQTKKEINKRIKQESDSIKGLYEEFESFDLKISTAIKGTNHEGKGLIKQNLHTVQPRISISLEQITVPQSFLPPSHQHSGLGSVPMVVKNEEAEEETYFKEGAELKSRTEAVQKAHELENSQNADSGKESDDEFEALTQSFLENGIHSRANSFTGTLGESLRNLIDEIEEEVPASQQILSIPSSPIIGSEEQSSSRVMDNRQLAQQQRIRSGELLLSSGTHVTATVDVPTAANSLMQTQALQSPEKNKKSKNKKKGKK